MREAAASPCPPRPEDRGVPRSLGKGQLLMSNDRRERRPWRPTPPVRPGSLSPSSKPRQRTKFSQYLIHIFCSCSRGGNSSSPSDGAAAAISSSPLTSCRCCSCGPTCASSTWLIEIDGCLGSASVLLCRSATPNPVNCSHSSISKLRRFGK